MNAKHLTVTGLFTHENLSIFLLRGSDTLDGSRFIPLDEFDIGAIARTGRALECAPHFATKDASDHSRSAAKNVPD